MWNVTVGGDAAAQGNHTITQSLNLSVSNYGQRLIFFFAIKGNL